MRLEYIKTGDTMGYVAGNGAPLKLIHETNGDRHWAVADGEKDITGFNELAAAWFMKELPTMDSVYNDGILPPVAQQQNSGVKPRTRAELKPVETEGVQLTDEEKEVVSGLPDSP